MLLSLLSEFRTWVEALLEDDRSLFFSLPHSYLQNPIPLFSFNVIQCIRSPVYFSQSLFNPEQPRIPFSTDGVDADGRPDGLVCLYDDFNMCNVFNRIGMRMVSQMVLARATSSPCSASTKLARLRAGGSADFCQRHHRHISPSRSEMSPRHSSHSSQRRPTITALSRSLR